MQRSAKRASDGHAALAAPSAADLPSNERRDAELAWLDQLANAGRFIDEILDRHRYGQQKAAAQERQEQVRIREVAAMKAKMVGR